MTISRSIVEAIRSLDPPGRFLDKDPETGFWYDIGHKKAVEKTSQALRDGAAMLRRQLSADLGDPGFLDAVFNDGEDGGENDGDDARKGDKGKLKDVANGENQAEPAGEKQRNEGQGKAVEKSTPAKVRLRQNRAAHLRLKHSIGAQPRFVCSLSVAVTLPGKDSCIEEGA